jgi:membrane-associated protein
LGSSLRLCLQRLFWRRLCDLGVVGPHLVGRRLVRVVAIGVGHDGLRRPLAHQSPSYETRSGGGSRLGGCLDSRVLEWLDYDRLADWVSGEWWGYLVIFAIAVIDAFFPLVPSESLVVLGGSLSADGDMYFPLVVLAAATGAVIGDNISFWIGHFVGEHTVRRLLRSQKWHRRFDWAEKTLDERGAYIIVIARFIPGGRTAVTFSAGYLTFPWRRFIVYDVIAAILWATYAATLGYFGGKTFEDNPVWGLVLALAIALSVGLLVEVVRHFLKRRRERAA